MRRLSVFARIALVALPLAACVAPSEPPPRPAPPVSAPTPTPPPPPPPPPPTSADWRDWPLTPGTWTYSRNAAQFGAAGMPPELLLQCEGGRGRIQLSRRGATPANVNVRTTSLARTLALRPSAATPGYVATDLPARDALLDAMGFSRGRFVVEGGGLPTLVVPAWAEILRVVEDCR